MIKHFRLSKSALAGALGLSLALSLSGCVQSPPANPNPPNDPAGLGTPQERLKALESNTTMPERLKARKMKILQDEISGSSSAPGAH